MKKGLFTQSLFVYDLCHRETGSKPAFAAPKPSSPCDSLLTAVSPCVILETDTRVSADPAEESPA